MPRRSERPDRKLISSFDPACVVAERYRVLRTNLRLLTTEQPLRTVLITSSLPGEGKTLTTANLAISLAHAGAEVIVLDADLRRSHLHRMFSVRNNVGLTSVLTVGVSLADALQKTLTPKLRVLTSGPLPTNPAELLGSARMSALIQELASMADMVLIDSPPVVAVADPLILSSVVDGVILVVRSGEVPYQVVQKAKAILEQSKARILGVVLDAVSRNSLTYGGYGNYYSYRGDDASRAGRRRESERRPGG